MSPSRTGSAQSTIVTAIDNGIMAALGGGQAWGVFCALVRSLPNIRPSRKLIADRSGVPVGSINRHTRRMVQAGLLQRELRYRDGGGRLPTRYTLVDLSDPETVAGIVSKLASQKSLAPLDRPESKITRDTTQKSLVTPSTDHGRSQNLAIESSKLNKSASQPESKKPKAGARDPVWDAVAEIFFDGTVARPHQARAGRIVRDLKDLDATPADIRARLDRYREQHPTWADTPEALVKHWCSFAKDPDPKVGAMPDTCRPVTSDEADADEIDEYGQTIRSMTAGDRLRHGLPPLKTLQSELQLAN